MKHSLIALLCGAVTVLMAADTALRPVKTSDFEKINGAGTLVQTELDGESVLAINGVYNFRTTQMLAVDPGKIYKLSGEFMAKPGTTPAKLYFGIASFDSGKKMVVSESIYGVKGTDTELVEDAKAGDTVLKIKNFSLKTWRRFGGLIAFNTKPDFSDLPNMDLAGPVASVEASKTPEGFFLVTLKKPLKKAYPKGTAIRYHFSAGTYQYSGAANAQLSHEWKTFFVVIKGESPKDYAVAGQKWWYTTRYVKILILGNYAGKKDSVTLFRNLKLEELTR